jgi:hypothetical protein
MLHAPSTPVPAKEAPPRRRFPHRLVQAGLAAVLAVTAYFAARGEIRRANPWSPAGRFIESRASSRDLVVVWTENRQAFDAFDRENLILGLPAGVDLDETGRQLEGFDTVWLVVPPGAAPPTPVFLDPLGTWRTGNGMLISRYQVPERWPVVRRLGDEMARARVARVPAGREPAQAEACPRNGERHVCPGPDWRTVDVRPANVGGKPERCIFAHPANGERLHISFPGVPGGSRLVGWLAVADSGYVRDKPEPPVLVRVEWRGEAVAVVRAADAPGRQMVRLPLPTAPARPGGVLTLVVAAERDSRRHFCFDLWIETPAEPPPG